MKPPAADVVRSEGALRDLLLMCGAEGAASEAREIWARARPALDAFAEFGPFNGAQASAAWYFVRTLHCGDFHLVLAVASDPQCGARPALVAYKDYKMTGPAKGTLVVGDAFPRGGGEHITALPNVPLDARVLAQAFAYVEWSSGNRDVIASRLLPRGLLRWVRSEPAQAVDVYYADDLPRASTHRKEWARRAYILASALGISADRGEIERALEEAWKIFSDGWGRRWGGLTPGDEYEEHIVRVMRVFEGDNLRLAILANNHCAKCLIATPRWGGYNHLDAGNYVFNEDSWDCVCGNDVANSLFLLFDPSEFAPIENASEMLAECREERGRMAITREEFEALHRAWAAKEAMERQRGEIAEAQQKAVGKALRGRRSATIGGITFGKFAAEYQGQRIGAEGTLLSEVVDVERHLLEGAQPDFAEIYRALVGNIFHGKRPREPYIGKKVWAGGFTITINQTKGPTRYAINGVSVGFDDLRAVIERALCFKDAETYATFLGAVRSMPLRAHDLLANGATFSIGGERAREAKTIDKILMRVVRDGGAYCLAAGEAKARVHGGFRSIIAMTKREYASEMGLYNDLRAHGVGGRAAVALIAGGRREFVNAEAKAKELLDGVLKRFPGRIRRISERFDGEHLEGYAVKGKKGQYFVADDCRVYSYPHRNYICVVDKGAGANMAAADRLVARIYALLNDSAVAGEIHTLRGG